MLAQSCSQMHVHSLAHVQDLIPTLAGILYIYIYVYLFKELCVGGSKQNQCYGGCIFIAPETRLECSIAIYVAW